MTSHQAGMACLTQAAHRTCDHSAHTRLMSKPMAFGGHRWWFKPLTFPDWTPQRYSVMSYTVTLFEAVQRALNTTGLNRTSPLIQEFLLVNTVPAFSFYQFYLFIFFKQLLSLYVFIFGCARSSCCTGFFLAVVSGVYSPGFSLCWLLLLQSTGSRHVGFSPCSSWALEQRLNGWGARV